MSSSIDEQLEALTGGEHFLMGLSPHFWAHIPLTNADVHSLGLVDGIDCIVLPGVNFIPVTKCCLAGVIVHVDRKSNGSVLYLLDDGTGLMDCLVWANDFYKVPPLLEDNDRLDDVYKVGGVVKIWGRIRVVNIQPGSGQQVHDATGKLWTIQQCVREIHVVTMEAIGTSNLGARFCSCDQETEHWNKVLAWRRELCQDKRGILRNGVDVLKAFGANVAKEALARTDFPSPDDDLGAWQVFGASCRCELSYKSTLLYCHCQATVELSDPNLTFRDALLTKLIRRLPHDKPLSFTYQSVLNDDDLEAAARSLVGERILSLFAKTFAALRKDGIVHLADQTSDTYILISRERVIEPFVQKRLSRDRNLVDRKIIQTERTTILRDVPNARIQYVKRCLEKLGRS
jgi:hypothetical protein